MTLSKQTIANRKNAKKSTGPKTAKGKAISSQNALKHGLRSAENRAMEALIAYSGRRERILRRTITKGGRF